MEYNNLSGHSMSPTVNRTSF